MTRGPSLQVLNQPVPGTASAAATEQDKSHSLTGLELYDNRKTMKRYSDFKNNSLDAGPLPCSRFYVLSKLTRQRTVQRTYLSIHRNPLLHRPPFTRNHSACGGSGWCDVLRWGYLGCFSKLAACSHALGGCGHGGAVVRGKKSRWQLRVGWVSPSG